MAAVWNREHHRMLPIHQGPIAIGESKSKALIKAHILSGDDCMSRGGEKIDEIDKIKVTPCEFGATHCVLNGDNFCFS